MPRDCERCGAPLDSNICPYCGTKYSESEQTPFQTVSQTNNYYYTQSEPTNISSKSRLTAFLLCFFLGYIGVHRFYLGQTKMGILYFFTVGLCGIGWLYDLVMITLGKTKDANGHLLS